MNYRLNCIAVQFSRVNVLFSLQALLCCHYTHLIKIPIKRLRAILHRKSMYSYAFKIFCPQRLGKISAQPHPTLCIQFSNREKNDKNNTLTLGRQICFTFVWGRVETLQRAYLICIKFTAQRAIERPHFPSTCYNSCCACAIHELKRRGVLT